jgi:hypothetical protein
MLPIEHIEAIQMIVESGENLTASGKPKVSAFESLIDDNVSSEYRDQCYDAYLASLEAVDEPVDTFDVGQDDNVEEPASEAVGEPVVVSDEAPSDEVSDEWPKRLTHGLRNTVSIAGQSCKAGESVEITEDMYRSERHGPKIRHGINKSKIFRWL